jgi:hypothetical protein
LEKLLIFSFGRAKSLAFSFIKALKNNQGFAPPTSQNAASRGFLQQTASAL